MDTACETLLRAAIRAPSGDNMQPWGFVVDSRFRRIAIFLDPKCDSSPMNAGQRMSRLAIGAALENMHCAAAGLGWSIECEDHADPVMLRIANERGWSVQLDEGEGALATIRIVNCDNQSGAIPPSILERCTNRRAYDNQRAVPDNTLADLKTAVAGLPGVQITWVHQRERVLALADLVGRADALMLGVPSMRSRLPRQCSL